MRVARQMQTRALKDSLKGGMEGGCMFSKGGCVCEEDGAVKGEGMKKGEVGYCSPLSFGIGAQRWTACPVQSFVCSWDGEPVD